MGAGLALLAYVFTDNLSTAIIIFGITAGLIFVAHPICDHFIIIAAVVIAIIAIGVFLSCNEWTAVGRFRVETNPCMASSGEMRQEMAIRQCRHCMRLAQEDSWAEDLETVSRSWKCA